MQFFYNDLGLGHGAAQQGGSGYGNGYGTNYGSGSGNGGYGNSGYGNTGYGRNPYGNNGYNNGGYNTGSGYGTGQYGTNNGQYGNFSVLISRFIVSENVFSFFVTVSLSSIQCFNFLFCFGNIVLRRIQYMRSFMHLKNVVYAVCCVMFNIVNSEFTYIQSKNKNSNLKK